MRAAAFHSQPGAAGAWAHLLCAGFAIALPALLGFALTLGIAAVMPGRSAVPAGLQHWLAMLIGSPALTWMVLVPGLPLAVMATWRGRAGWATFALGGGLLWLLVAAIVGGLLHAAWTSALGSGGEGSSATGGLEGVLTFLVAGACAGLAYWLGLRLAAAHLFAGHQGIAVNRG